MVIGPIDDDTYLPVVIGPDVGTIDGDTDLPVVIGPDVGPIGDDTNLPVVIGPIDDDGDLSVVIGPDIVLGINNFVNELTKLLTKELAFFFNFKKWIFLVFFNTTYEVDTVDTKTTNSIIKEII